jgi:hypothetical protein
MQFWAALRASRWFLAGVAALVDQVVSAGNLD